MNDKKFSGIKISLEHRSRNFSVPVKTARGIFISRESIVVTLEDENKNSGQGEIAPWPGFECESIEDAEKFLTNADIPALLSNFPQTLSTQFPCTIHALEAAKFFLENPAAKTLPETHASAKLLLRSASVPEPAEVLAHLKNPASPQTFKIKIGLGKIQDEIRFCKKILYISDTYKNVKIRFDANGAWDGKDALDELSELTAFPSLEFIEQPLAANARNDALVLALPRERAKKFALDESLREPWMLQENAEIIAVVKPLLIGNFQNLRRWLATSTGTRYVISTVFESEVGRNVLRFLCHENRKNPRCLVSGLGKFAEYGERTLLSSRGEIT